MTLTLFDLDGTLLTGDSDLLWTRFLVDAGVLAAHHFDEAAEFARRYVAACVVPDDFCRFHASLLAGRSADELLPLRQRFLADVVRPRIPAAARRLVQQHRDAGDRLLLTTATHRIVSEFTAQELGFDELLCTELQWHDGRCTGDIVGHANMRAGKLQRLREWLAAQGLPESTLRRATFYSDSFNDLALLSVVGRPVVVDPDNRLRVTAVYKGWQVLRLRPEPHRAAPAAALA